MFQWVVSAGASPLPDLFLFQLFIPSIIVGKNKSGRGACPRCQTFAKLVKGNLLITLRDCK